MGNYRPRRYRAPRPCGPLGRRRGHRTRGSAADRRPRSANECRPRGRAGSCERPQLGTGPEELIPHGTDERDRLRVVAVDAYGPYAAVPDETSHLFNGLARVGDEGTGLAPWNEIAVRPVPPVRVPLGEEVDPTDRPLLQPRARESDNREPGESAGRHDRVRVAVLAARL